MNNVIEYKIAPLLNYNELSNMYKAGIIKFEVLERKKKEILESLYKLFPKKIISMIGKNNMLHAVKIDWNPKWLGFTQYIDNITLDELNNTISYGIDLYRRPFIFVKIAKRTGKTTVLSIFQRYSYFGDIQNQLYVVIEPRNYILSEYFCGNVAIDDAFRYKLKNLFQNKVDGFTFN